MFSTGDQPPFLASLGVASGTEVGGNTVPLNGSGFLGTLGASAVQFGGVNAASYVVVSDILINAVPPALGTVAFAGRGTLALSSTPSDNTVNVSVTKGGVTSTLPGAYSYTSELARIAGALYHSEYRANDPRLALNAGNVSSWPSYSGANALAQATASKQPALEAAGWNGGPSILADGVDDGLVNNAVTGLPTATRPFVFLAIQRVSGTSKQYSALISATGNNALQLTDSGTQWRLTRDDSSGASAGNNAAAGFDTNKHLIYRGFSTAGTNALVIDGTGTNSTRTGNTDEALTQLSFFSDQNGNVGTNGRGVMMLVLKDEPTAQNVIDILAAIKTTIPWVGFNALSLSLP